MKLSRRNLQEITLGQLIFYLGIYLWDSHIGVLLCTILGTIALFIAIISHIVEWVERSKVPGWYFYFIWISTACPFLVLIFMQLTDQFT